MDAKDGAYYYRAFINFLNDDADYNPEVGHVYRCIMDLSAWARKSKDPLFSSLQDTPSTSSKELIPYCEAAAKAILSFLTPPGLNSPDTLKKSRDKLVLMFLLDAFNDRWVRFASPDEKFKNCIFVGWLPVPDKLLKAHMAFKNFKPGGDAD